MLSELQTFQVLGLLFFASGLGFLINPGYGRKIMDNLEDFPALMFISSLVAVVAGYILVSYFNIWSWDWVLLLTITGWGVLLKGVFVLLFPAVAQGWIKELKESYVTLKAIGAALVGFIFLVLSFYLA